MYRREPTYYKENKHKQIILSALNSVYCQKDNNFNIQNEQIKFKEIFANIIFA